MKTMRYAAISISVLCLCGCASTQQAYERPTNPEPILIMSTHTDFGTGVTTESTSATGTHGEKYFSSTTTTNNALGRRATTVH